MPTSSSGGTGMRAVPRRISDSTPGAILQPQPPPCDSEVRRGSAAGVGDGGLVVGIPAFDSVRIHRPRGDVRIEAQGADVFTASLGYLDWYEPADFDGQTAVGPVPIAERLKAVHAQQLTLQPNSMHTQAVPGGGVAE